MAGCRIFGEEGAPDLSHALIVNGCAPTDGPAVELFLSEEEVSCGDVPRFQPGEPQERSYMRLMFYERVPSGAELLAFDEEESGDGQGQRCVRGGACEAVRSASVRFGVPGVDGSRRIEVQVTLAGGEQISRVYTALFCRRDFLCG